MSQILSRIEEIICLVNDVLVFGSTQEQHVECLIEALLRLQQAHVTLNQWICKFTQSSLELLGQILDQHETLGK